MNGQYNAQHDAELTREALETLLVLQHKLHACPFFLQDTYLGSGLLDD